MTPGSESLHLPCVVLVESLDDTEKYSCHALPAQRLFRQVRVVDTPAWASAFHTIVF